MKAEIVKQIKLNGEIKTKFYSRPYFDTNENSEEGILIYNDKGEHVVICFDVVQKCCENFKYEIPKEMFKHKCLSEFGVNIIALKYTPDDSASNDYNWNPWNCGEAVPFIITTDDEIYNIWAINSQNGYYSHIVSLDENDKLVWESCI